MAAYYYLIAGRNFLAARRALNSGPCGNDGCLNTEAAKGHGTRGEKVAIRQDAGVTVASNPAALGDTVASVMGSFGRAA